MTWDELQFKPEDFKYVDMSQPKPTCRFGMEEYQAERVANEANRILLAKLGEVTFVPIHLMAQLEKEKNELEARCRELQRYNDEMLTLVKDHIRGAMDGALTFNEIDRVKAFAEKYSLGWDDEQVFPESEWHEYQEWKKTKKQNPDPT